MRTWNTPEQVVARSDLLKRPGSPPPKLEGPATPQQAQDMHEGIRAVVRSLDADAAKATRIIYGGSVNADNAAALFAQTDIDGALVGGASLQLDTFTRIIAAAA